MFTQFLRILPGEYQVLHAENLAAALATNWISINRAPEGVTVVCEADASTDPDDRWVALYSGDGPHGLDVPGVLALLVGPLAAASIPVFVASTFDADMILVPHQKLAFATTTLTQSGHEVITA